jgi:hypothetical protein
LRDNPLIGSLKNPQITLGIAIVETDLAAAGTVQD